MCVFIHLFIMHMFSGFMHLYDICMLCFILAYLFFHLSFNLLHYNVYICVCVCACVRACTCVYLYPDEQFSGFSCLHRCPYGGIVDDKFGISQL